MSKLSENLRYLRDLKNFSQQKLAEQLNITRGRYAKYEDGISEPPLEIMLLISHYYHISIDLLISRDLKKVDMDGLLKLEGNRILLPIKADKNGNNAENFIEIIPQHAKAGYLTGYSDPEFIENLQHISLPFLKNGKFRAFPIEGDSMPPHKEGSFIIGKYIENIEAIKDGKTFVILTKSEGIVYKRLKRKNKSTFTLSSDNDFYKPYEIKRSEILELWQYECSLATKEFEPDDLSAENVRWMFKDIVKGISGIQEKLR